MSLHQQASRRRFLQASAATALVGVAGCDFNNGRSKNTLILWNWDTRPAWLTILNTITTGFTKETGIKVEVVAIPSDSLDQKLEAAIPSHTLPDLYYGSTNFPAYVEQEMLVKLDDVIDAIGRDKFYPALLKYSVWKGATYAIPFINYPRVVWYRIDHFQKKGLDKPTSWAELAQAAEALNAPSDNRYGFLLFNKPPDQPPVEDFMVTNDAKVVDAGGHIVLDSPRTVEALAMVEKLSRWSPPGTVTKSQQEMRLPFMQGQGGMMITSTSVADVLAESPQSMHLFGAFPVPINRGRGAGLLSIGSWQVTRDANLANTRKFLRYFFRTDIYTKFAANTVVGHLPTIKSIAESKAYLDSPRIKPWQSAFTLANSVSERGVIWGEDYGLNTASQPIGAARIPNQMQDKVLVGKQDPAAAVSWAQQAARDALEQNK